MSPPIFSQACVYLGDMEVNHSDSVHPAVARQTPGHEQENLGTSPGCSCQLTPPRVGEGRGEEEKLTGVPGTAAVGRPVLVIERFISLAAPVVLRASCDS